MPKFEGTFESPVVPVRGPFVSLIASESAEPVSALQTTPDGASEVLLSFGTPIAQTPESTLHFELYEDIQKTYSILATWLFSGIEDQFVTLKKNKETLPALPHSWRVKVIQGSPLRAVYVNSQYI